MTLQPLASIDEFAARLPFELETGRETARVAALIDDASAQVRIVTGRDWTDGDGTWQDYDDVESVERAQSVIRQVVVAAAMRAYMNPDGIVSETLGSWSVTRARATATGSVTLTPGEQLALLALIGRPTLTSIEVRRPDEIAGQTAQYLSVIGGGDPMPWLPADDTAM